MSVITKDLGAATAYGYAVEKGYTGTEEEFAELMASYATVGQTAVDAKDAAQTAATTATNKASEATTAAQTATTKAGEASTSANTATSAKDTAVGASQTATSKATEATTAATSANTAKTDAVAAKTAAETAQGKAETAQGAAEQAAESVSASAAQIATNTADITDLKEDLTQVGENDTTSVSLVMTAGKIINAQGEIISAQTSYAISQKVVVSEYNSVVITTEIGYGNMLYAFYTDEDAFISGEQSASSGNTTITDKSVHVPATASYIYVCAKNTSYAVKLTGISAYHLNIEEDIDEIKTRISAYPAKVALDNIAFTQETGDYINPSGTLVSQGSSYYTTGYVDVSNLESVYVTASANYNGALYAFYDENKVCISVGPVSGNNSTYITCTDTKVPVPFGAKYIIAAGRFASLRPNLKKFNSYQPVGSWYGKKWVCMGDSLTEANSAASKHYFDYIADVSDITVVNMGVGGSGYKRGYNTSKAFYQRIANAPTDADFLTIFGSGNDLNTTLNYDIGTYTDSTTDTLCGCINATLDAFYTVCPTIPIGIIAPTPWLTWPTTTPNNRMEQYVEAMQQVCAYRGVPFLDLYHCSNLRPENQANREACFYSQSLDGNGDGVHPNALGHKIIAPKIYEFVKNLLI